MNGMLELLQNPGSPAFLQQFAAVFLSLAVAWAIFALLRKKLGRTAQLVFPLSALGFLLLTRAALKNHHLPLIDFFIPIFLSWSALRIFIYMLRTILPTEKLRPWEKAAGYIVLALLALHLTGVLADLLDALDEFSFRFGKSRVSLLLLLQGILSLAATLLIALWASRALERRIMKTDILDMNLRVMFAKIARTALITIGVLIGLSAAGIDMTALSMFGGALGVGLGLGLQKIVSNYISGFIVLLDRSIHLGDVVTVDNHNGMVKQLTNRYIVLQSSDGTESLIPNDTLITSTVVNHSYSDKNVRIPIAVQVSYSSSLETAMRLLQEAGEKQERVLSDPAPQALLRNFADSGINLELGIWIADPENGTMSLVSEINLEIWRSFREHGIEIPYPQREIRMLPT